MDKIQKLELALKNIQEVMNELETDDLSYDWLRKSKNSLTLIIYNLKKELK